MNAKDFRNVLLFMCNRWSKGEANLIFNKKEDGSFIEWPFSMGEHVWNKWSYTCENHHGSLDGIAYFLLELDNGCIQKLIDRSLEYYNK